MSAAHAFRGSGSLACAVDRSRHVRRRVPRKSLLQRSTPRQVKDRGIYAPLTFSGRLAVNGVVVSSYAASSSTMAKAWQLHQSLPWETMLAVGSAPFRYFFGYHLDSAFSRIMQAWSSVLPSMITDPRGRTSAATTVWSKLFDVTLWSWMANDRAVRAGEKLATTHAAEDERAEGLLAEGCDIGGSYVPALLLLSSTFTDLCTA